MTEHHGSVCQQCRAPALFTMWVDYTDPYSGTRYSEEVKFCGDRRCEDLLKGKTPGALRGVFNVVTFVVAFVAAGIIYRWFIA